MEFVPRYYFFIGKLDGVDNDEMTNAFNISYYLLKNINYTTIQI